MTYMGVPKKCGRQEGNWRLLNKTVLFALLRSVKILQLMANH